MTTPHPPANPTKWAEIQGTVWIHLAEALDWKGTDEGLTMELERLAKEKGIEVDIPHEK